MSNTARSQLKELRAAASMAAHGHYPAVLPKLLMEAATTIADLEQRLQEIMRVCDKKDIKDET